MTEPFKMCPICLRTDKKLKTIATVLSAFHDQLTEYSIEISNPKYCDNCEYLLRKTYNFHQKCSTAAKTLKKWMSTTKNKISPNLLHLSLPTSSLDTWTPENSKVFTCTSSDNVDTSPLIEMSMSDKLDTDTLNTDSIKEEVNENRIITQNFKVEIQCDDNQVTEDSERILQKFNNRPDDTTNVYQNKLTNNDTISTTGLSGTIKIEGNKTERFENKINQTINDTTSSVNVQNKARSSYIEVNIDYIKTENKTVNKKLKSRHDMPKPRDDSNNKTVRGNETEVDNEIICLDDDDSKKGDVIVIDDKNESPDDASLNSDDDCDDYFHTPQKKRKSKKTLNELANIELSDEDFDENYVSDNRRKRNTSTKKDYSIDNLILTEKKITSKLANINETLDTLCENWNITSLKSFPNLSNDEVKIFTRKLLTERKLSEKMDSAKMTPTNMKNKSIITKLACINTDLDSIKDTCETIVEDYKKESIDPKERLKMELIKKFESRGELKAEDGFIFDKDIIINCLDKVPERLVRQALQLLHGTKNLKPSAARCLKMIQNKHQDVQYESVFDIEYLTTQKEILEEFKRRKTYECYVEAKFKCEICYQGFKHERHFEYHKKCHDECNGSEICSICSVRQTSPRMIRNHMYNVHGAVYKCKLCPLVTYYRISMTNHYEQHKGTLYKCESCGTSYKSKSVYLTHQNNAHPRGANVCTICGGAFVSPHGLKTHIKRKHRDVKPVAAGGSDVRCEVCDLTFQSQEAHLKHQMTWHGMPAPYKKRNYPKVVKPRKKPIMICRVCNTVGHSIGWLGNHFRTEHPLVDMEEVYADQRTYLCDVCGKGYANKYNLRKHIHSHAGVTFPCPTCAKGFHSREKLWQHRRIHGPPGFCCERCGKKFHSHSNLYNHMRTHIGDRRFKCNICGKGFLHRSSLRIHIRGVHNHERRIRESRVAKTMHGIDDTMHGIDETMHGIDETMHGIDETGSEEME